MEGAGVSGRIRHVAIAGGGLAGIAAAVALADTGFRVTLIESRKKLGGRATSHTDPATGELIDNCQHVAMGCCHRYISLMNRLGVLQHFDWTEVQHWVETGGRVSVIAPGGLPEPLHLATSFAKAKFLSWYSKAAIARGVVALKCVHVESWIGRTFGEWLAAADQPDEAVRRFWEPVVVSACNLSSNEVAAPVAMKVFREGLLAGRAAAKIGVPRVPLKTLYDGVEDIIRQSGGEIRLGVSVERIRPGRIFTARGTIDADAVICALPPERAVRVIDPEDPRRAVVEHVTHSPIVGMKLWLREPLFDWPHAVLVDRTLQWLFPVGWEGEGWAVHGVISAAKDLAEFSTAELSSLATKDLVACFPKFGEVDVLSARVVKEKRATFAATPGWEAVRNGLLNVLEPERVRGSVVLAGDYTNTGWPATMEGAVVSGEFAAKAIEGDILTPDFFTKR